MRLGWIAFTTAMLCASNAWALQPLKVFIESARKSNNANRISSATRAQAEASASEALGSSLPSIDVRGIVAYSQFEPTFPSSGGANGQAAAASTGLIPRTIWLGNAGITVPINVGSWEKIASARASTRAAEAGERATAIDVERDTTRAYYDLVGGQAVLLAAQHARDLSAQNLNVVSALKKEGEGAQLDVERATADLARADQDMADATGNVLKAQRHLASLAGIEPQPVSLGDIPSDDLHEESPLAMYAGRNLDGLPKVQEAANSRDAQEKTLNAARAKWLPTISGQASEVYTNATENLGRKDFYTLVGIASWHIDLATPYGVKAEHALVDAAKAREAQSKIDAADAIYDAWIQVRTDIDKTKAARVMATSAGRAADLARARFLAGEATQLDVLQALQTYIQADVSRIRVESDLVYARSALRLSVATK